MTSALMDDPGMLSHVAGEIEEATGIPAFQVVKDFWVTEMLRSVSAYGNQGTANVVFKGGTSLSKAFRLIHRFSEDVDILLIPAEHAPEHADRCMREITEAAEVGTGLKAQHLPAKTVSGVKSAATLRYAVPSTASTATAVPAVLLELGVRGGSLPTKSMSVNSLIVEHGAAAGIEPELLASTPFNMHVMQPVRTLVEKLMIVHHAASTKNIDEQQRLARHYYDIWCLLSHQDTVDAFVDSPAQNLASDIRTFTEKAGQQSTSRPPDGFVDSPAFDPGAVPDAKSAFETVVLVELLWPNAARPSFESVCALVREHAERL